jgi:hypothetical protein
MRASSCYLTGPNRDCCMRAIVWNNQTFGGGAAAEVAGEDAESVAFRLSAGLLVVDALRT